MERLFKQKGSLVAPQAEPNLIDIINKIQERLVIVDRKMDTLISKSQERQFVQQPSSPPRHDEGRHNNNFRGRTYTKVICADCNKECEVPFKPSADRPVYCRECFAKRKHAKSFREKPTGAAKKNPYEQGHLDKGPAAKKQKTHSKKKSHSKKRR